MTTSQPLHIVVDDLVAQIQHFISHKIHSSCSSPASLLVDIYLEGSDERQTYWIRVPPPPPPPPPLTLGGEGDDEESSTTTRVCGDQQDADSEEVEADQLQQLALDDRSASSASAAMLSPSTSIRLSSRARKPVQRLDYLLKASSHCSPRTRKRPAASTEEDNDSDSVKEGEEEAEEEEKEKDTPAREEVATLAKKRTLRGSRPVAVHKHNNNNDNSDNNDNKHRDKLHSTCDEVAVLVAKLRAASRRRVSMEAVSPDAIAQLGREVLLRKEDDTRHVGSEKEEDERCCADTANKIAVLIATSTTLRMLGYYFRAVLAVRLKATHRAKFTEAARRLLGIRSTADIAAYPAFYAFVQQHCPSIAHACATVNVDVDAWLKEPVLIANISWTAWRRYLSKPNRWMLDKAMEEYGATTESLPMSPSTRHGSCDDADGADEADGTLSFSDDELTTQDALTRQRRRSRHKRAKPLWTAPITVSGYTLDAATTNQLQSLRREHRSLTKDVWNSHVYHLAEHNEDVAVGTTNGEVRQAPFCELLQTLMSHPSIPVHARLQSQTQPSPSPSSEQASAEHFWLDVGSGYGLAVLRARIMTGAKVCAGIEIATDRVFISHQLAEKMDMQRQVHFVSSDVCHPQVLPILLAATHLFAYSAVFSAGTQDYLANVLSRPDSSWLLYVTCDKTSVLERAGLTVHTVPHALDCRLGGVHLLGHTKPLSMSTSSSQGFIARIYLRCMAPHHADTGVRSTRWTAGMAALVKQSTAAASQSSEELARILTPLSSSLRRETRSARQLASLSVATAATDDEADGSATT